MITLPSSLLCFICETLCLLILQSVSSEGARAAAALVNGAAARVAGVHGTTIWRAITSGELEARRLGRHGHYRVTPDALEAWLQTTQPEENA
jgi:excisionase family DNA binding protein